MHIMVLRAACDEVALLCASLIYALRFISPICILVIFPVTPLASQNYKNLNGNNTRIKFASTSYSEIKTANLFVSIKCLLRIPPCHMNMTTLLLRIPEVLG
jgi:hypothetical protein